MTVAASRSGLSHPPPAERPATRRVRRALAAFLLVWGVFYLAVLAAYPGAGTDFADFYAASRAAAAGQNPYDWPTQWRWEDRLLNHGPHRLPRPFSFAPYGNPPPFANLLAPLSAALPPRPAYAAWTLLAFLVSAAAAAALCRWNGQRRPLLTGLLLAAAPCATFDLFLGQDSWLVLAALAAAVLLAAPRPLVAGVLLVFLGFAKPHLVLPLAAVLLLAYPARRRSLAAGLALGTLALLALVALLSGPAALAAWLHVLSLYRQSIAAQPDLASLPGLYTAVAPPAVVSLLDLVLAAAAAVLVLARRPAPTAAPAVARRFLALGVAAVLAALPYAHTHDDILLVVPLLVLCGPTWSGLRHPLVVLAAVVTLLAPLGIWSDYHRPIISTLPALCTLLACLAVPLPAPASASPAPP